MKALPLLLAATALAAPAHAYAPGGAAYTKRVDTALLADPSPLAQAVGHVGFAQKLAVDEVKGVWLRVRGGPAAGWVFAGNVAAQKPSENKGADGLPIEAAETSATAAARPLAPAANDFAQRRNLGQAREDLDWLIQFDGSITPADISAYMQEHKKGEFQ
jgi:hypothetical protein